MAVQRRLKLAHGDVFPSGAYMLSGVEQVLDYDKSSKDAKVQAVDLNRAGEGTGLPLWQVQVVDADPEAGKRERTVTVKIAATHQPVPPKNETGLPFTLVEFTGLTAMPYVEENPNGRDRLAWSFRADGMVAPGASASSTSAGRASKPEAA
ncbi:MAG: plasmid replication, integration and excision activator [Nocardioides sp.]